MVAPAMAIAERAAGAAPDAIDGARLSPGIRAGLVDAPGPEREEVRTALWRQAREALRIANPKLLADQGLEASGDCE